MVKQTLPCAGKNCKSKMTLTDRTDNLLYYNCITNHDEHTFRYNIKQKKWEKIIIKTKIILHYNENPCDQPQISVKDQIVEINQKPSNDHPKTSNKGKIKRKESKKGKKPEQKGIKEQSDSVQISAEKHSQTSALPEHTKKETRKADKQEKEKMKIPVGA